MLLKRSFNKEIIDDFAISGERLERALSELKVINYFLGGNSVSRKGISDLNRMSRFTDSTKILDMGSGASDLFFRLKTNGKITDLVSADLNLQACRFTRELHPGAKVVCCNALMLPFKKNSFDIVHASLFFHHFREQEILDILEQSYLLAEQGIVINDLRRSVPALAGIKVLTRLFSKSSMVKNDAPLSVKRGFTKRELKSIFSNFADCRFVIKRKWAFRWLIYCAKNARHADPKPWSEK
ncbi:MAG: methyltransferase domain-containing protein [Ignavibacteria bacterium]|jgi:SAM-dependent methyltransferase|nr:methyltransferase domain-containing protein [Ignavibacteria bacterium]MCU7502052.1 methyltransferase domain-containing protein [Ignavibacteria bacterium]MCU7515454.1 methyltransferase domain-containing protein [Ignavibacteria bacterium]